MINEEEFILTVIIPTYNNENYIQRCLDSVINQSLKSIKIIIIDDGSTDNSLEVIKQYARSYDNIEYCVSNRVGPGAARNIGISKCTTKYLAFIDSDDWIDLNAYKKCTDLLEKNPQCNVAVIGVMTEYDSNILTKTRYTYEYENVIDSQIALKLLTNVNNYNERISPLVGNKVFRSELIKTHNIYFPQTYFEDTVFMFKMLYFAKHIILIPNKYLHYYQRNNSIMHSFSKKYISDFFQNFFEIRNFLECEKCFSEFENIFYAYFQRGCNSLLNILFSTEQDVQTQKKYLIEFIYNFEKNFDIDEIIKNMDINLIKKVWGI